MKKPTLLIPIVLLTLIAIFPYLISTPPLKRTLEWAISQKTGAEVRIEQAHFRWFGPQKMEGVQIHTAQIDGRIAELTSSVPFWKITSMDRSIDRIDASGTTNIDGQSGQFSFQGSLTQFQFSVTRMPTSFVDQFLNTKGLIVFALGSSFDASGSASLSNDSGEVDLNLSSSNATASLKGAFTPEAITLREPLTLSILLTPELTKTLTKGSLAIQGIDPARLRIEPNGFRLLRNAPLTKMQIPEASIDLGRVLIQNANFLVPLFNVLKANISTEKVRAWLTATNFSLKDNQFTLERIDALVERSIHICAWGGANLAREQLDMIFGISGDTLSKSFGIQSVSSNYVLQIPVTGSFSSPQFDTGSATGKIAALLAAGQIPKGGVLGQAAAGLIGKAIEKDAPPPKRPFPWER